MSEIKHTPGPWRFNAPDTIVSNQSHPVARLTEPHNRVLYGGAIGNDGPLIAAAPDLYAALEKLVAHTLAYHGGVEGDETADDLSGMSQHARTVRDARAALAKARGES